VASPAGLLDRHAAPLTPSLGAREKEAEKAVVKPQAAGESEHAVRGERGQKGLAGRGKAG